MIDNDPIDHDYLISHARSMFPRSEIEVTHSADELIHIDVNGHRYTFEIGSDDDEYVFTDGKVTFTIPLMDSGEDF